MKVNFKQFLSDELLDIKTVSRETGINEQTLYGIVRRGATRTRTIRTLLSHYPNVRKYIRGDL